jgi:hypothetical protein
LSPGLTVMLSSPFLVRSCSLAGAKFFAGVAPHPHQRLYL